MSLHASIVRLPGRAGRESIFFELELLDRGDRRLIHTQQQTVSGPAGADSVVLGLEAACHRLGFEVELASPGRS